MKTNPDGVIEWYENEILRGEYLPSRTETFDRDFTAAYRRVRSDTNIQLIAEIKVAPNRPMEELVRLVDLWETIRSSKSGLGITEYQTPPLITVEHLQYMDLLERQRRGHQTFGSCLLTIPPKQAFQKALLFGEEFEMILDFLNPLPVIEAEGERR